MTYNQTIDFLFSQLAMYQKQGPTAYKPGLETTQILDEVFGSPSKKLKVVHVAGTNGKGSTSHSLASVLQAAGLSTGLFTSPHLLDFRERIRINGEMIPEEEVTRFVDCYLAMNLPGKPSFFELTTIMAFDWFACCGVDVAVIEVGLGGRLDSTNIVNPILSVITNISLDHTAMLGSTEGLIAAEKAGIIKPGIPAVVGEARGEVRKVFEKKALAEGSPIYFAEDASYFSSFSSEPFRIVYHDTPYGEITSDLTGSYQPRNMSTILASIDQLISYTGLPLTSEAIAKGLADVVGSTGLMGRWSTLGENPLIVCDTGHNIGGWEYLAPQLSSLPGHKEVILGFVNDKDLTKVLKLIGKIPDTSFHFTQASVERALPANILAEAALKEGITGTIHENVASAYETVRASSAPDDTIFVGGSTFVVADLLLHMKKKCK